MQVPFSSAGSFLLKADGKPSACDGKDDFESNVTSIVDSFQRSKSLISLERTLGQHGVLMQVDGKEMVFQISYSFQISLYTHGL